MPENQDALRIYMIIRGQYIMGFNGPVDINHLAVWEAIDRFGVKDPVKTFEKVVMCARISINEMMDKNKSVET